MKNSNFPMSRLFRTAAIMLIIFSVALSVSTSIAVPDKAQVADLDVSFLSVNTAQAENVCDETYTAGWYYKDWGCCAWSDGIMCAYYCSCF